MVEAFTNGVLADIHAPFEDTVALNTACRVLRAVGVTDLYILGDGMDLWHWSRFDKSWIDFPHERLSMTPQAELDYGRELFADILRRVKPKRNAYWVQGNHEERAIRGVERGGDRRPLPKIDSFHKLMGLAKLGYKWVPHARKVGQLWYTHGDVARKYTAAKMLDNWKANVIYGHAHRRENFTHNPRTREIISAWGIGCLCHIEPSWTTKPDWHHGEALVTHVGRRFHVESVHIIDGETAVGGKLYAPR